jgi:cation:H+ antiporter
VRRMLVAVLGGAVGLVLLAYASDQFVVGAARAAALLRLSPILIGAVVIGFGTSAPELLVSGLAAGQGSLDIAVGNIVGSNVANLSLVLGTAALLTPISVHGTVLRREAPISLAAVVLFAVLVQGSLGRVEGGVLLVALVVALWLILRSARTDDPTLTAEVGDFVSEGTPSGRREGVRIVLGLAGTLAGAQLLVVAATTIAAELGLAEGFVGLTIVAIGTSLPELATAVQAARKAETDLIVGNLLGSNLFNSAAVGGAVAMVGPGTVTDPVLTGLATLLMVAITTLAAFLMATGRRVVRWEGAVLLAGYLLMLPFLA